MESRAYLPLGNARLSFTTPDVESGISCPEMEVVFRDTNTAAIAIVAPVREAQQWGTSHAQGRGDEEPLSHPIMEVFGDKSHWVTLKELEIVRKLTQARAESRYSCGSLTRPDLLEAMSYGWNEIDTIDSKPKRWIILALWAFVVASLLVMLMAFCIVAFVLTSILLWGPMVAIIFFWLLPYCEEAQLQYTAYVAGLLTVCSAAIFACVLLVTVVDMSSNPRSSLLRNWGTLCETSDFSISCVMAQYLLSYALFQAAHVLLFIVAGFTFYGMVSAWSFCCALVDP